MSYLILTERNEWENETWSFYFEDNKHNRKAFEVIKKIPSLPSSFRISECDLTAKQINNLPDSGNYMSAHNVIPGKLNIESLEAITEYEDQFYKGSIADFIIDESLISSLTGHGDVKSVDLNVASTRTKEFVFPFQIWITFKDGKQYCAKNILEVPSSSTKTEVKKMLVDFVKENKEFQEIKDVKIGLDQVKISPLNIFFDKDDLIQYDEKTSSYHVYPYYWTQFDKGDDCIQNHFNIYKDPIIFNKFPEVEDIRNALKDKDSILGINCY